MVLLLLGCLECRGLLSGIDAGGPIASHTGHIDPQGVIGNALDIVSVILGIAIDARPLTFLTTRMTSGVFVYHDTVVEASHHKALRVGAPRHVQNIFTRPRNHTARQFVFSLQRGPVMPTIVVAPLGDRHRPHHDGPPISGRQQMQSIRTKLDGIHSPLMPIQRQHQLNLGGIRRTIMLQHSRCTRRPMIRIMAQSKSPHVDFGRVSRRHQHSSVLGSFPSRFNVGNAAFDHGQGHERSRLSIVAVGTIVPQDLRSLHFHRSLFPHTKENRSILFPNSNIKHTITSQ
mmetsp:Transcript_6762/g.12165  ORF Transcript_6762/g.12165 Transcript_6762/m.12165 type:complete len:287 (+) Transcript_6762:1363-2223(+)